MKPTWATKPSSETTAETLGPEFLNRLSQISSSQPLYQPAWEGDWCFRERFLFAHFFVLTATWLDVCRQRPCSALVESERGNLSGFPWWQKTRPNLVNATKSGQSGRERISWEKRLEGVRKVKIAKTSKEKRALLFISTTSFSNNSLKCDFSLDFV